MKSNALCIRKSKEFVDSVACYFLDLPTEEQAEICAQIHTESSADGVESHGLNRIPRFADYVKKGLYK